MGWISVQKADVAHASVDSIDATKHIGLTLVGRAVSDCTPRRLSSMGRSRVLTKR